MRFAIRDDDTNFFTTPGELEACYSDIWHETPVTLALISKVKGNWKRWVHQIYQDRHNTDWAAWSSDDSVHPIEDNKELVAFLRQKVKEGKIDIAFHARYHRNGDDVLPSGRANNYIRGAEFFTTRDLTAVIREEVDSLNQLLGTDISVFTPPQNLLSALGYRAVINSGLNLCGGGIPFFRKERTLPGLINMVRQGAFRMLHRNSDYPRVLRYSHHTEIPYHYPLQPNTHLRTLTDAFDMVRSYDGDFVVSTHYVEFDYPMVYDEKLKMKNVLDKLLEHVSKYKVEKVTLSTMLRR